VQDVIEQDEDMEAVLREIENSTGAGAPAM